GQVVVDRDNVDSTSGKRIEVNRQGRNQRFTFAGFHLGDLALVQHNSADQLHIEVPHLQHAPTRLARHREGLGKNLVQRLLHFPFVASAKNLGDKLVDQCCVP